MLMVLQPPYTRATYLLLVLAVLAHATIALAQPAPSKPSLDRALGVAELKLAMAESTYKLRPTPQTLSEVVAALEDLLNSSCLPQLQRTLSYKGNPSDEACKDLVERLLQLYPEDPVALCVQDGIDSPGCTTGYAFQVTAVYGMAEDIETHPDPAFKVGLSRSEIDKLEGLSQALATVDQKYQASTLPQEKQQCINDAAEMYDQALATSCRIVGLSLTKKPGAWDPTEDGEVKELRDKLLSLPPSIREDYQGRMTLDAQRKLQGANLSAQETVRQRELLRIIEHPEKPPTLPLSSLQRVRFILPQCAQFIEQAAAAVPGFPSPVCHKVGWFSPQCVAALRNWNASKARRQAIASGTPVAPAKTPSIISTF